MASTSAPATIGLPVYNAERYLEASLKGLLEQTDGDFDLVVADNGSTDGTLDIVEAAAAHDSRIRLLRSDRNRGAAWNFNRLLDGVETPYFRWVAGDDVFLPDNHRAVMEEITSGPPDVVLVYPRTGKIGPDGEYLGPHDDELHLVDDRASTRYRRYHRKVRQVHPIFGVIRTDVLLQTQRLGAYFRADTVLLAELVLRGKFVEIPEELFHRRFHPEISIEKHASHRDQAIHYDPTTGQRRFYAPSWRLGREHLAAIARAPISAAEKARCVAALDDWPHKRRMLREARGAGLTLVARARGRLGS